MTVYEIIKPGFKSYNPGEVAAFGDGPDDIGPVLEKSGYAKKRPDIEWVDPELRRGEQAKDHLRERTEFARLMGSGGNSDALLAELRAQTQVIADLANAVANGRR